MIIAHAVLLAQFEDIPMFIINFIVPIGLDTQWYIIIRNKSP